MKVPKRPISGNWVRNLSSVKDMPHAEIYDHLDGRRAITSVDLVEEAEQKRFDFHISTSFMGYRPTPEMALATLRDFAGAEAGQFEEDNHLSGRARHYWMAVEPHLRRPCPCKDKEEPVHEGDFTWRKA